MKKICFIIILLLLCLPVNAIELASADKTNDNGQKVFVYHLTEDEQPSIEKSKEEKQEQEQAIPTDDITQGEEEQQEDDNNEEVAEQESDKFVEDYYINDMYSDVLYGYASMDDEIDISLDDTLKNEHSIKIKKPTKANGGKYYAGSSRYVNNYSRLGSRMETSITPTSGISSRTKNGFSAGTTFDQYIDTAEIEQSTGVFSRYDTKYFALTTSYVKTVNTTNNNYNDNFYFAPEWKINQYFTLKNVLSADIRTNRKKAEVLLSINPFGKKDQDRMRIELGANATYVGKDEFLKNQFKFSTKFKL